MVRAATSERVFSAAPAGCDPEGGEPVHVVLTACANDVDEKQQILDEPVLVEASQRQGVEVQRDRFGSHKDVLTPTTASEPCPKG
jgi:hypothetical protein